MMLPLSQYLDGNGCHLHGPRAAFVRICVSWLAMPLYRTCPLCVLFVCGVCALRFSDVIVQPCPSEPWTRATSGVAGMGGISGIRILQNMHNDS